MKAAPPWSTTASRSTPMNDPQPPIEPAPREPRRGRKGVFVLGILAGAVATVLVGLGLTVGGAIDMQAAQKPGWLDALGHVAWESSVMWRSGDKEVQAADLEAVRHGFDHYRETCVVCHGAPQVAPAEWTAGMLPKPPDLTSSETQERSDADLFHIIRNGVRMSGMPAFGETHGDAEIREMLAFVRRLPNVDAAQQQALRDAVGSEPHAHAEANAGD